MSSEETKKARLSRRDFMKIAAIGGAAAAGSIALGGCDATAAPTDAPIAEQECPPAGVPATWDYEADVVVIGLGGAGASVAIAAHDEGAKVLVLEKQPADTHRSNSSMCGGVYHVPHPDSDRAALVEYIKAGMSGENVPWKLEGEQPHVSQAMAEMFAEGMFETIPWLLAIDPDLDPEGLAAGGDSSFPMFPSFAEAKYGATQRIRYKDYGDAEPGVTTYERPKLQKTGGEAWMWCLVEVGMKEQRPEIELLYNCPAKRLVQREDGEILGVIAEKDGQEIAIKAKKAVALTSGGFEYSLAMRRAFSKGPGVKGWCYYGTPDNTGDGIRMAMVAGASLAKVMKAASRMETAVPYTTTWTEYGLKRGMNSAARYPNSFIVNNYGKRYIEEPLVYDSTRPYRYQSYEEVVKYNLLGMVYDRVPSWMIFDETFRTTRAASGGGVVDLGWVPWPADNLDAIERGWILKGDTIEDLAAAIKAHEENRNMMDAELLAETVSTFNGYVADGEDLDFNRQPDTMGPVETPPFYAIQLYPGGPNTKGGVDADAERRVLDWDGKPMARLFTAGEISSVWKFTYQAGGNVTECMVCGRVAGRNAAALTAWDEA
ncbi:MAG: FAD-binding protein [Anaerolineae bacterium]|nr:FAD-binding protein [Anaerolineae bacterium]